MDEPFEIDDTHSFADASLHDVQNKANNELLETQEREHEKTRIEQHFLDIETNWRVVKSGYDSKRKDFL